MTHEEQGVPRKCLREGAKIHLVRRVLYEDRGRPAAEHESVKTILKVHYNPQTQRVVLRLSGVKTALGGSTKYGLRNLIGGHTGKWVQYDVTDVVPCT